MRKELRNLAVIVACAILFSYILLVGPFVQLERSLYDFRMAAFPAEDMAPTIQIIGIDQKSLDKFGPWPWPRSIHARLIRLLKAAGARAIVFDVLFNEPKAEDQELARAMREAGNVVLASYVDVGRIWSGEASEVPPNPLLHESAKMIGFINVKTEEENRVREVPLVAADKKDRLLFSLDLASLATYWGMAPEDISVRRGGVAIGKRFIPLAKTGGAETKYGTMRIKFSRQEWGGTEGKTTGIRVDPTHRKSYSWVLDHPSEVWRIAKDRIVLVGPTSPGFGDDYQTAVAARLYGVEIHANVLNTILQEKYIKQAPPVVDAACFLLLPLAVAFGAGVPSRKYRALSLIGIPVGFVTANFLLFRSGIWLALVPPLISTTVTYVATTTYRYFAERKKRQFVDNVFGKFVPEAVKNEILSHFEDQMRKGTDEYLSKYETITIMESDIRGFTSMSEKMHPHEVFGVLNAYFSAMIPILEKYQGTFDKYVGDALLAYFGAPYKYEGHEKNCVLCSLEMQETLGRLRDQGILDVKIGIGVNTGSVMTGTMGAKGFKEKIQYTVIGDPVNLAARLCSVAEPGQVIISSYTYEGCKNDVIARELEPVRVKGKSEAIQIYEVLGKK
ncbi:MAG: adenylate/guanylate cyclase domain-containing protein [Armatimonadetes bacterium]|nr:adenylate/guanylate cyclase domain-containing protein [Armatimonadota bacterium]